MELLIAAVVTLVVQTIKKLAGTSEYKTLAITVGVSLVGGGVYWLAKAYLDWEIIGKILLYAAGLYTLILRRFETKSV